MVSHATRLLLDEKSATVVCYSVYMRNLSIALAVASAAGALGAVLPIAISYVIQPSPGALYVHAMWDFDGLEEEALFVVLD